MPKDTFPATVRGAAALIVTVLIGALAGGCASPSGQPVSNTTILTPDQESGIGGSFLDSQDLRTIAARMTAELLSTPEIAEADAPVRIAIAPIRNSTRYMIDSDIFMRRLRLELNRNSGGQVRFLAQDLGQGVRAQMIRESEEERWEAITADIAEAIIASAPVREATAPKAVAVLPIQNTNLVGVNADSMASMIRSAIAGRGAGKLVFLSRERNGKVIEQILGERDARDQGLVTGGSRQPIAGVDYFLGGEFVGQSLSGDSGNVTKHLIVKLIDAASGVVVFEQMVAAERAVRSGVGRAQYLLTGEISGISKAAAGGDRSDYVLMSFQLVDPQTNDLLWEDAYETKKRTSVSVVYR